MVRAALEGGLDVVVLDNVSTGMRGLVADGAYFHQAAVSRVVGCELPAVGSPRRPGDPPALIADPQRIKTDFGWRRNTITGKRSTATAHEGERRLNSAWLEA